MNNIDTDAWNKTTRKEVMDLIEMLYSGRESISIDHNYEHENRMELSFMRRKWYVNMLTGECRMEHRQLADDHIMRIVTDTESFDSVKAMKDYILEKLW